MTPDFNEIYWMLEHDFRSKILNNYEYFIFKYASKFICIRKIADKEIKPKFNDQYMCFINKHEKVDNVIQCSETRFDLIQDWASCAGRTPKEAIFETIKLALEDPQTKNKNELKDYKISLNPFVNFFNKFFENFKLT